MRVTDWLSVGGGAAITYGKLDYDLRAPVKSTFVKGDYRRNDLFLLGLALQWKKLPWSGKATF